MACVINDEKRVLSIFLLDKFSKVAIQLVTCWYASLSLQVFLVHRKSVTILEDAEKGFDLARQYKSWRHEGCTHFWSCVHKAFILDFPLE